MASMEENNKVSDVEKTAEVSSVDADSAPASPTTPAALSPMQYRQLIWKLDLHLLPPLFALWFVSLIDRVNIGNANIQGLQKDLHMKGNDFNVALLVVLVGLITMEVPSNFLLKKTSPSMVLALESLLLGIFTIGEGVITNFTGLKALRFFVGVFEAGLIPGSVYLLAQYYPRYELQWRVSMLMVGNALSTAFGGLLALAAAGIKTSNHWSGWRWIFVIEGCMTVGVTLIAYPFMSNWPETAKWLSVEEKAILSDRIRKEGMIGKMDKLDSATIKRILFDWKIYVCGIMYCCTTVTVYSVAIFAPTIISQYAPGQSARHVQALFIPIFISAAAGCLTAAYASDKLKHRSGFALFGYLMVIAGLAIMMDQKHVSRDAKYGALYLMSTGSYMALPMLWTMLVNNISGSYKTGFAVAVELGIGNVGGIASALIFQQKQAPLYLLGWKTTLGMTCSAAGLVIVYTFMLWRENKARNAGKRDHRFSSPEIDNMGDDHPEFRYGY